MLPYIQRPKFGGFNTTEDKNSTIIKEGECGFHWIRTPCAWINKRDIPYFWSPSRFLFMSQSIHCRYLNIYDSDHHNPDHRYILMGIRSLMFFRIHNLMQACCGQRWYHWCWIYCLISNKRYRVNFWGELRLFSMQPLVHNRKTAEAVRYQVANGATIDINRLSQSALLQKSLSVSALPEDE